MFVCLGPLRSLGVDADDPLNQYLSTLNPCKYGEQDAEQKMAVSNFLFYGFNQEGLVRNNNE